MMGAWTNSGEYMMRIEQVEFSLVVTVRAAAQTCVMTTIGRPFVTPTCGNRR